MNSEYDPAIKKFLPHEKMYTIQIGNERFILSGASLSSDGPSYFTNYFANDKNADKTLLIDRSPEVFRMIYSHLQGYYLEIHDADTFTKVFIDALYYNLPRLRNLILNSEYYFVNISGESVKIPKKLLNTPGNTPNFFTIGNDVLYKDISQIIVDMNWIRPPPQAAPTLNRCPLLLKELVSILQEVEIEIRSDTHRRSLIKEAKYYRFNGLVQKLIKYKITYNPFHRREEIVVSLEYLDHKCLVQPNSDGLFQYQRHYVDQIPRVLIIQIEDPDVSYQYGRLLSFSKAGKKLRQMLGNWGQDDDGETFVLETSGLAQADLTVDGKKVTEAEQGHFMMLRGLFKVQLNPTGLATVHIVKAEMASTEKSLYTDMDFI